MVSNSGPSTFSSIVTVECVSDQIPLNMSLLTVIDETISKLDPAQEAENNRGDQENIGKDRHHGKKRPFAEHEAIKSARKHDTLDGH